MSEFDLRIISLGAGVQSSTMALMSSAGDLPEVDFAIFADTQWESAETYRWLDFLEGCLKFPVYRVTAGDIRSRRGAGRMPWYIRNDGKRGILHRACTHRFKLRPMEKFIKARIDWKNGAWVERWIGITTDEAHRMKPSNENWEKTRWPLIEARMSRGDCYEWLKKRGYPNPPKSACIGCPFRRDILWLDLKRNHPEEFQQAVEFEREHGYGPSQVADNPAFLHDTLKPLDQVEFKHEHQPDLFGNECEGMCGV